jgi:hypothetical protein
MTLEMVKALSDADLEQVGIWAQEEVQERTARHKQENHRKNQGDGSRGGCIA